jgi:hypothetical protein
MPADTRLGLPRVALVVAVTALLAGALSAQPARAAIPPHPPVILTAATGGWAHDVPNTACVGAVGVGPDGERAYVTPGCAMPLTLEERYERAATLPDGAVRRLNRTVRL